MFELIIYFLALMNPFALFIYTLPLIKEFPLRRYAVLMARATLISWLIYLFFVIFGNFLFDSVLKISFDSFRIFGGLVLTAFALSFIIQGKDSMITTKGELSKIAAEVALPFMVGAGTITLSIVLGSRLGSTKGSIAITIVMLITLLSVIALAAFRRFLRDDLRIVLDKNLEVFLRLNGFIVGAFGIDLIVIGVQNLIAAQ